MSENPSQSINISGGQLSNVQVGGQGGRDLNVSQTQNISQGELEESLTPTNVVELIAQLEELFNSSDLPKIYKEKAIRHLENAKEVAQEENPDKDKGSPKFAIYSGAEDEATREKIRAVYNSPENKYGAELKALLATSAGAEGIDLKNIRQVHIMEPYWHDVRISQVIGRANRFMSHVELPEKDRVVDVYRYMTVTSEDQQKVYPEKETTDQYIYGVALKKLRVTDEIKKTMKEIAVDCTLNAVDNEKDIKCFSFGVDAQGLAYKADIKADMVYGKTELATKTVKKALQPMFLDGENRLIWADKKKKQLCYFNNKTCKEPLKEPPKEFRKVAVDMDTLEVFDVASAKYGNPIKLGEVDERGVMI